VCPTCPELDTLGKNYRVQLFPRSAVLSRALTAEHVPPKAFRGRELVLTCKTCNNYIGGSQLEGHARRRENPIDLLLGNSKKKAKVRLTAGGHRVNAKLGVEGNMATFLAALPGEHSWSDRRIIIVREPEWLQSYAVQIGRYVVFLPKPGDIEFYSRLNQGREQISNLSSPAR
jgi:hypothetical protein